MALFSKQTVNSIIADIVQKIEHLHVVAEAEALAAEVHDAVVAERKKLGDAARAEAARAKTIAEKLRALVSSCALKGDL